MTQKTQRPGEAEARKVALKAGWGDRTNLIAAVYPVLAAAALRSAADVLSEGGDRRAAQVLERLANEQEQRDA